MTKAYEGLNGEWYCSVCNDRLPRRTDINGYVYIGDCWACEYRRKWKLLLKPE